MTEVIIAGIFTILGAILGVIITEWNKRGKIFVYSNNLELNYMTSNEIGGYLCTNMADKSEYLECLVNIQLYNSSDFNKLLRDIKIEFKINGTRVTGTIFENRKGLNYITLKPKEFIEKIITVNIYNTDEVESYIYIKNEAKIDIIYKDAKSNTKSIKLQ